MSHALADKKLNKKLPSDWELVKFENYIDLKGGSQPPKSEFKSEPEEGYVRLLQIRDFGENPVPTYVNTDSVTKFCNKDDVLIARYGASLGRILTGMEGAYNVALVKVISDDKDFLNKYLFYLLQTQILQRPLTQISRSAQNGFAKSDLADIKLPKPPLETQHRIIEKIEELFSDLDKGIENLEKTKQQLETYKQSVLKAAFEGKLTNEWREQQDDLATPEELKQQIEEERKKYREQQLKEWEQEVEEWKEQGEPGRKPRKPRKPKQIEPNEEDLDNAPNVPNNWVFNALDSLSNIVSGHAFKSSNFEEEGVPVIKIANVGYSQFKKDGQEYLDEDYLETHSKYVITENDLLIALTRPITSNTTKTCFYPHTFPSLLNQRVGAIKEPIIKNKWILYYFQSIHFQNYMRANFTETLQPNLSITDLRLCPIPIPCFREQKEIINSIEKKLSIVEQNLKTIDSELQKAEALRQSILKKAFEGKLIKE